MNIYDQADNLSAFYLILQIFNSVSYFAWK